MASEGDLKTVQAKARARDYPSAYTIWSD